MPGAGGSALPGLAARAAACGDEGAAEPAGDDACTGLPAVSPALSKRFLRFKEVVQSQMCFSPVLCSLSENLPLRVAFCRLATVLWLLKACVFKRRLPGFEAANLRYAAKSRLVQDIPEL